jgi:GNAT superfamily N-acetyltransferase
LRFEAPDTRLDGLMIAFDHDAAVGMCQLTCPAGRRWAFIEMTGVLRPYRGRGLATAMKLRALQARSWGCSEVRTFHNPKNLAIIAANRSLGFREADFDL